MKKFHQRNVIKIHKELTLEEAKDWADRCLYQYINIIITPSLTCLRRQEDDSWEQIDTKEISICFQTGDGYYSVKRFCKLRKN